MKIKEEYLIESGTRKRWYNIYTCDHCGIEYKKQKRLAEGATQEHYCSSKCFNSKESDSRVKLICAHCNIEFFRSISTLNRSKHGVYFCCREHKDIGQSYIKEIQPEHYGTGTGEHGYRLLALNKHGYKCMRCGYDKNNAAIVVHHKDHNRDNNLIENLEVLCANCHAIHHWG